MSILVVPSITFFTVVSKDTLRKLKLVQDMTLSLPTDQAVFASRLASTTEQSPSSPLYSAVEANSSSNREFTGDVGPSWFTIRRRASPFSDSSLSLVKIEGTVSSTADGCLVELELNAFHPLFHVVYGLLLVFYAFMVLLALDSRPMLLAGALLHAATIGVLPYLLMRRVLSRMKYYLEREFFFLTKKVA